MAGPFSAFPTRQEMIVTRPCLLYIGRAPQQRTFTAAARTASDRLATQPLCLLARVACILVTSLVSSCAGNSTLHSDATVDFFLSDTMDSADSSSALDTGTPRSDWGPDRHLDAGADCSMITPHFFAGTCVECLQDEHCDSGHYCDKSSLTCHETAVSPCELCDEESPLCVLVDGAWKCVQCESDSDCQEDYHCAPDAYTCVPNSDPAALGTCSESSACPSSSVVGFDLTCDSDLGLCFDEFGWCDGIYSVCKPGSQCIVLSQTTNMELLLVLPEGATPETVGLCSCDNSIDIMQLIGCYDESDATPCAEAEECFTRTCNMPKHFGMYDAGPEPGFCADLTDYFKLD
jgi:hypothetical protein